MVIVKIEKLCDESKSPTRATSGSSGFDLYSRVFCMIEPGCVARIPTGIRMAIPEGFEGQIRPRSGMAVNSMVTVANSPGTIDADYRGEVCVLLINLGRNRYWVSPGCRVAQMIVAPVVTPEFVEVEQLDRTDRGSGGFGSTGV